MDEKLFVASFNRGPGAGYIIDYFLAEGGQARVYGGHHGDEPVAIKVFTASHDLEAIEAFKQEADRVKALQHGHIIGAHWLSSHIMTQGWGRHKTTREWSYMVMELANGGSVKDLAKKETLAPETIVGIIAQAMEGIKWAHGEGRSQPVERIVHRDLKPANLLIHDGVVKVADFGIAVPGHSSEMSFTETQVAVGTAPYMAPEQFNGRALLSTDQYGMAVVAYELLAGRRPIQPADNGLFGWLAAHQTQTVPPIKRMNEGTVDRLTEALEEPIMRALSKDPKDRYPSMGAFQEAWKAAAQKGAAASRLAAVHIPLFIPGKAEVPVAAQVETPFATIRETADEPTLDADRTFHFDTLPWPPLPPDETPELAVTPPPERLSMSRRRFMGGSLAAITLGIVSGDMRRNVSPQPRKPEKTEESEEPLPPMTPEERRDRETAAVTAAVKEILEALYAKNGADAEYLHLLHAIMPFDANYATVKIQELVAADDDQAVWITARLVPHNPSAALQLLDKLEKSDKQNTLAIVSMLAAYSQRDPDSAVGQACRRAALERSNKALIDDDKNDFRVMRAALQPTGTFELSGEGKTSARDIMNGLLAETAPGQLAIVRGALTAYVSALAMAIAPYDKQSVSKALDTYINLAEKDTANADELYGVVQLLCNVAAPHDPAKVAQVIDRLAASPAFITDAYSEYAALQLAPYDPGAVAAFVRKDSFADRGRHTAAIGLATRDAQVTSEVLAITYEPIKTWIDIARDPLRPKHFTRKLHELINDSGDLGSYGVLIGIGLLNSRLQP